ncbi:MAG: phage major tail tube protein [Ruminococcus sp.]|nr:phage major tail tube protein [Ruminococcus sp.]
MEVKGGIIDYAIYENGSEYLGTARITLPDISAKTFTTNGAGIPGDISMPVIGSSDAMTVNIQWIDISLSAYTLLKPTVHTIDCRAVHEGLKSTGFTQYVTKYILQIIPTKLTTGQYAPATAQSMSGDYSCIARKDYIGSECVLDYQPLNNVYKVKGTDYLATVRKLLGKN